MRSTLGYMTIIKYNSIMMMVEMMIHEYNKRHSEDKFFKPIISAQFVLVFRYFTRPPNSTYFPTIFPIKVNFSNFFRVCHMLIITEYGRPQLNNSLWRVWWIILKVTHLTLLLFNEYSYIFLYWLLGKLRLDCTCSWIV